MKILVEPESTEPTNYYAFVDSVEPMSDRNPKLARVSLNLDCVEQEKFDSAGLKKTIESERAYALVRVITTVNQLMLMSARNEPPREGDWYLITIQPRKKSDPPGKPNGRVAWRAPLVNFEFETYERARLTRFEYLSDELPPSSVGAAAAPNKKSNIKVKNAHDLRTHPTASNDEIGRLIDSVHNVTKLTMRDVGHANFTSIYSENTAVCFFDVGWPIWHNLKTIPQRPSELSINEDALVILSHWDWDHFYSGFRDKQFHERIWIAPAQTTGPTAAKLAGLLLAKGKLKLVAEPNFKMKKGALTLLRCKGPESNRNNSGLALICNVSGDGEHESKVLLTGDADYSAVPNLGNRRIDGLAIPHHGAASTTTPPRQNSSSPSNAIGSVGRGNVYNHPKFKTLREHQRQGWDVNLTCKFRSIRRGDKSF